MGRAEGESPDDGHVGDRTLWNPREVGCLGSWVTQTLYRRVLCLVNGATTFLGSGTVNLDLGRDHLTRPVLPS